MPKPVFAMLLVAFLAAFGTIIFLGCYAQPAKDDYLSAVMFRGMPIAASLREHYALHNGRLLSALLMRFSPLQYGSFAGYGFACIGFAIVLALAMQQSIRSLSCGLLHPRDSLAAFFAVYLGLHLALGNLSEFYFWLPAISCYGAAALLFIAFLRVLPAALRRGGGAAFILSLPIAALLPLSCEPAAVLGIAAIAVCGLRTGKHSGVRCGVLAAVLIAAFLLAALSPGNALRLATSPHSRSILQTFAGALYSMSGTGLRLLFGLLPAVIFIGAVILRCRGQVQLDRMFLFRASALVLLFWFGGEMLAFWAIGGMPALRVRNSFLLLSVLLWLLVLRMAVTSVADSRGARLEAGNGSLWLSAGWIALAVLVAGSPFRAGMQDLISGTAARYDADMKRIYAEASRKPAAGGVLKVSPVREIPASLYIAQPLILEAELRGWPWLNVQMASYFGYTRIYADSLAATPTSEMAFQNWLRAHRGR